VLFGSVGRLECKIIVKELLIHIKPGKNKKEEYGVIMARVLGVNNV